MTDKVQKIREEVARIQLYTQSEVLKQVLDYIDEVQKEPVSEVWHDVTEKPNTKRFVVLTKDGMITTAFIPLKMSFGELAERARIKKWAYLDDLVNLSNVQRTVKNWKEPVSKNLMDVANNYCLNVRKGYPRVMDETDRYICNAFKAGAEWQKEQMMKEAVESKVTITSKGILLEDLRIEGFDYEDKVKLTVIKEE